MQKHLYFICPTDFVEPIINKTFEQDNFFFSSLGNSVAFDEHVIWQIKALILTEEISKISFILSDDNRIVLDGWGDQRFAGVEGLGHFYQQINKKKEHIDESWNMYNPSFLLLSNHLNDQIKELKLALNDLLYEPLPISGKIYNRKENVFHEIYSDLVALNPISLN